jgi:hypothetical protein
VTNGAFGIEVTTEHIDSRYMLKYTEPVSTPSGDLRLFEIEPERPHAGLPSFSGITIKIQ